MNIIENLRVYDADDTLLFTPKPDKDVNGDDIFRFDTIKGKEKKLLTSKEFEKSTGNQWKYTGWWSHKESLDMNIFDIKINKYVYNEYLKDICDINNHTIMMTGRIKKLEQEVRKILDYYNFKFDRYYFNPGDINTINYKIGILNKYIKENKELKTIKIYDDRDEHITEFTSWGNKTMNDTTIDVEIIHIRGEGRVN